jgi:hypothetical protein
VTSASHARLPGGLLHDKPFDAGTEPGFEHEAPKAGAGALSVDCSGNAGFLTGRASEADVGGNGRHGSNIVIDRHSWMDARQLPSATLAFLAHGHDLERASALQAERVEADATEQIEHAHHAIPLA